MIWAKHFSCFWSTKPWSEGVLEEKLSVGGKEYHKHIYEEMYY